MPAQFGIDRTLTMPDLPQERETNIVVVHQYLVQQHRALAENHDQVADTINGLPTVEHKAFFQDNAAAAQTDVVLVGGASGRGHVVGVDGSIVGIVIRSNAARAAGTLTVEATKNGSKVGLTAVLDATNTTTKATLQAADMDNFVAGDLIGAVITTDAGWLPVTADIDVAVMIVSGPGYRYERQ